MGWINVHISYIIYVLVDYYYSKGKEKTVYEVFVKTNESFSFESFTGKALNVSVAWCDWEASPWSTGPEHIDALEAEVYH